MRNFFAKMVHRASIIYLYVVILFAYQLIVVETTPVSANEREIIYPSGEIVGLYLECDGVFVIDTCEVEDKNGEMFHPAKGILKTGDYIISVNGENLKTKEQLTKIVSKSKGKTLNIMIERNGQLIDEKITPVLSKNEKYMIGVWIKDDLAGVGTMTYVTKKGEFGALGHGMNDGETNELADLKNGAIYVSSVAGIEKGEKGEPGRIRGILYYGNSNHLGEIKENTEIGIYGKIDNDNMTDFITKKMPYEIAYKQEVKTGPARIISEISGEIKYYDIEITYVDYLSLNTSKGLHIKVTDEELLKETGGIIQGMSGSPILQNGRVVGAVTHVLINDPTQGYGIFIENMLR